MATQSPNNTMTELSLPKVEGGHPEFKMGPNQSQPEQSFSMVIRMPTTKHEVVVHRRRIQKCVVAYAVT